MLGFLKKKLKRLKIVRRLYTVNWAHLDNGCAQLSLFVYVNLVMLLTVVSRSLHFREQLNVNTST